MDDKVNDIAQDILILGDFNSDFLNKNTNVDFHQILSYCELTNIITKPTRITNTSSTLIDPISISAGIRCLDTDVIDIDKNVSDHRAVYLTMSFNCNCISAYKRNVWKYKRADFNYLIINLETQHI